MQRLRDETRTVHVRKDVIHKEVIHMAWDKKHHGPTEKQHSAYDEDYYEEEEKDHTPRTVLNRINDRGYSSLR
jgi:hypothetical protein